MTEQENEIILAGSPDAPTAPVRWQAALRLNEPSNLPTLEPSTSPTAKRYHARFVRAGQVKSRLSAGEPGSAAGAIEVLPEALSQAAAQGLFDRKAVFVNHASLWENQDVERLVGVTANARFVDGAVLGELEMYPTPLAAAVCDLLDAVLEQGERAPDIGLSIVFSPVWEAPTSAAPGANRSGPRRITAIRQVESVDLVFQPAAGGRILHALSMDTAADPYLTDPLPPSTPLPLPPSADQMGGESPATISQPSTPSTPKEDPMPESPTQQSALSNQQSAFSEQQSAFSSQPMAQSSQLLAQSSPLTAPDWLAALAASASQLIIANSGLPQPARERLLTQFAPASLSQLSPAMPAPVSPAVVEQAIAAERSYLAALAADQVIQIGPQAPRSPHLSGMRTDMERFTLAFDALIAGVRPPDGIQPLTGLREAYHLATGDYEMSGLFHPERVMFASVNSGTMAGLVANALNKRVAIEFQQYPQWWAAFVTIEDFTTQQDIRWITVGGIGELPTVAEGAAYPELPWDDKTETSSFIKKGGYIGITTESIDKDDIGRLRAAPRALAQAAWLTLSKSIASIFTSNAGVGPTMSDSLALFHTSHANLGTTALSVSSYNAARTAMRKQTELNSGERLGAITAPRHLLVPPDLEITALQVLASENDYTYALSNAPAAPVNPLAEGDTLTARMNYARSRVIVVDLWTDTNDWAAVADPRLYPTIGLGFRYGRVPEIFSIASPTAGLIFTNDTLPVKVRFNFAVGPIDWKGLYKANV